MTVLVIALMGLGGLAAVLYPLRRHYERDESGEARLQLRELVATKETLYSTLKELDFDRVAGKLSEEDFRQLEARYRARAIEVLKAIDTLKGEPPEDDEELAIAMEREILALRAKIEAPPLHLNRKPLRSLRVPVAGSQSATPTTFVRTAGLT